MVNDPIVLFQQWLIPLAVFSQESANDRVVTFFNFSLLGTALQTSAAIELLSSANNKTPEVGRSIRCTRKNGLLDLIAESLQRKLGRVNVNPTAVDEQTSRLVDRD